MTSRLQRAAAFNLQFDGTGFTVNGNSVTIDISGGQTRKLVSRRLQVRWQVGWARVTSPNVTGTALFSVVLYMSVVLLRRAFLLPALQQIRQYLWTQRRLHHLPWHMRTERRSRSITLQLRTSDGLHVMAFDWASTRGFQHTQPS